MGHTVSHLEEVGFAHFVSCSVFRHRAMLRAIGGRRNESDEDRNLSAAAEKGERTYPGTAG